MKRLLKILLGLAAAIVLLLVLAAVLLPVIYDTDDLKQAISGEIYKQTGRELKIAGELDFSVFPWLAVEVNDLSLGNSPGFGDQPQAKIGEARAGVALLPLLRKQISIDEITLNGLELNLAVNDKGQNNWDDLTSGDESSAQESTEASIFSSRRIAGLNVRDARIEFIDHLSNAHYRLTEFSMKTGALGDDKPLPVELNTLLEDVTAGTRADIGLETTASIDFAARQYTLDDFELSMVFGAAEQSQMIRIFAPRLDMDLAGQTLRLQEYRVELAELSAAGSLNAEKILDNPTFNGTLSVKEFSPRELMQSLKMEVPVTADPSALQRAGLSTTLSGNSSELSLGDFALELDQSRLAGDISVRNFDRPHIGFTLAVDEIDLDRYLEPASSQDSGATEDVALPQEDLQGQSVQGQLKAGLLRMAGLEFSDAEVGVAIANGKLRLHPLSAGFYGGSYSGDITLDGSGAIPMVSLDEKVDSIAFRRLISDLVDNESISGTARGHVRLTGRGKTSGEVLGSLQGDLGLTLAEGALEGINIWYEIRRGMALYKGLPAPEPEPKRTVFSRMQVAGTVKDGVVDTRELSGELPFLTVRGKGAVDLARSQLDLAMVAQVSSSPELSRDPLGSELGGKKLPFRITGPLDAPSLSVDWEALLKGQATELLLDKLGLGSNEATPDGAAKTPQEETSKDQLQETAKSALSKLLGGKSRDKDKEKEDGGK